MISSIANSLGFGSGLDVSKLVTDLAAASRAPKVQALDARARASQAKISATAQVRSDLESFSTTLAALVAGGTLQSQPSVSDETLLRATAIPGARLGNFSGDIAISRLAKGQSLYSAPIANANDPVGQGTLTLAIGAQSFAVTIDATNDSLTGLANAITASGAGVTANIVNDTNGARLVLKGQTGAVNAFTVVGQPDNAPGLDRFLYGGNGSTMIQAQGAQDAEFTIDQIPYTRPSNSFSDVVPGVTLTLKKAAPGVAASIGVTRPNDAIRSTLSDFVSVFNQMKGDLASARTATGGDQSLRALDQKLTRFIGQVVTSDPIVRTLSDIGVTTNRDGTLSIDAAKLDAVLSRHPEHVEALFSPTRDATHSEISDPGVSGAFKAIITAATVDNGPLVSLKARLDKEASGIAKDRTRMEAREAAYAARLTQQYGSLDARVGALKATQTYLDQQIKLWTRST
jgi:flagellar hook-associated protein 2